MLIIQLVATRLMVLVTQTSCLVSRKLMVLVTQTFHQMRITCYPSLMMVTFMTEWFVF